MFRTRASWCCVVGIALLVTGLAAVPAFRVDPPAADKSMQDLRFLAGAWTGSMAGDFVEEHWTEPAGDAILGMFRWVAKDGKTRLFEILSIKMEQGGPTLRLRHFDGSLTPWKSEQEGIAALPLTEHDAARALFTNPAQGGLASIEYVRRDDELHIAVNFQDAAREPLRFRLKRVRPS